MYRQRGVDVKNWKTEDIVTSISINNMSLPFAFKKKIVQLPDGTFYRFNKVIVPSRKILEI